MPRNIPVDFAPRLQRSGTTLCRVLKVMPLRQAAFGITSLNADVKFDDGNGELTYRCKTGYTPGDKTTRSDMSVDNSEVAGLIAQYPLDGITLDAVNRGEYDGSPFIEYLIDYELPSAGGVIIGSGNVGQITTNDKLACMIELRSLRQVLKQKTMVGLSSITCRAQFGDDHCKKPIIWYRAKVTAVGLESDRTFTFGVIDPPVGGYTPDEEAYITGGAYVFPAPVDDYAFFVPGLVEWSDGDFQGLQSEIESFDETTNSVTLAIPVPTSITVNMQFLISQNCVKSRAMCIGRWNNIANMRAEPDIPLGNGTDLMSPTPQM